jgi:O-antigen ligase
LGVTIGLAILGFIQLIYVPDFAFMSRLGWDPHQGRLLTTFFDPNFAGGFFSFVISLILGVWFLSADKNQKIWLAIIGLIIFIALILTFSRSAYLGFMVCFVLVSLIRSWKITVFGLIIISLFLISFPKAVSRIKGAWSLDETARARIESWQQGWEIISDHPIVGVGYNTLPYVKPNYYFSQQDKLARSAGGIDSSILTIWATTGIFGLLIYLGMYAMIIWQSFKAYLNKVNSRFIRGFGLGLAVAMIGLLAHAQFVNSFLYPPMMILIWLCGGILFGLTYRVPRSSFLDKDQIKNQGQR